MGLSTHCVCSLAPKTDQPSKFTNWHLPTPNLAPAKSAGGRCRQRSVLKNEKLAPALETTENGFFLFLQRVLHSATHIYGICAKILREFTTGYKVQRRLAVEYSNFSKGSDNFCLVYYYRNFSDYFTTLCISRFQQFSSLTSRTCVAARHETLSSPLASRLRSAHDVD